MTSASVVLALATCSSDRPAGDAGSKKDRGGLTCGTTSCASGQVCCIDCDGKGSCGPPGAACRGAACTPKPDGGATVACGTTSCASGQVCCIDCDGKGSCGPPGTVCAGVACTAADGGAGACGGVTCGAGTFCCDPCHGFCAPNNSGVYCPPPQPCSDGPAGCGATGQACCKTGNPCGADLVCCTGVPYPADGRCAPKCELKSDRAEKEDLREIDPARVLDRLSRLPIAEWSYRGSRERHLGPMAQDFRAAFGLGGSERRIDMVDAAGVALTAIQALHQRILRLERVNAELRARLRRASRAR